MEIVLQKESLKINPSSFCTILVTSGEGDKLQTFQELLGLLISLPEVPVTGLSPSHTLS